MQKRKRIPAQVQKRLYQQAGSACCVCGASDVRTLEIHHIEDPSQHNEADMLVLCASCHSKAERGGFSDAELYRAKATPACRTRKLDDAGSEPNLRISGSGNVAAGRDLSIAGPVNIHTGAKTVRPIVMPGTVAEHPNMANYLNHLVKRYNEFKKIECDRNGQPMKYPLIRKRYEREFGCTVKDTPVELFDRACEYLQSQIDRTIHGKMNRAKGHKNYSTFEEYLTKRNRSP